jgi:ADP-heptose:LPS heptosyltransferase
MSIPESAIMTLANLSPKSVDNIVKRVAKTKSVHHYIEQVSRNTLATLEKLDRILVVSDTNIGDAVYIQSVLEYLNYYFPKCSIDYAYQKVAHPLIKNNQHLHRPFPVFIDTNFTSSQNNQALEKVISETEYDLIINFYPFFSNGALNAVECPILTPYKLVAEIVKTKSSENSTANVLSQLHRYINFLVSTLPQHLKPDKEIDTFMGNTIYLSCNVIANTRKLLKSVNLPPDANIVFLNPDTSSRFTLIPIALQIELVKNLLSMSKFDYVMIGPGFSFENIQQDINNQIPISLRGDRLIKLSKDIGIDTYAGLIDHAKMFITGDTAQMHIAASYKQCEDNKKRFKNKTALVSIFGATDSRIYGYDSFKPTHTAANQQAPSKIFEGHPRCKNLTCIHKTRKKCTKVRCFKGIQLKEIIDYIDKYKVI